MAVHVNICHWLFGLFPWWHCQIKVLYVHAHVLMCMCMLSGEVNLWLTTSDWLLRKSQWLDLALPCSVVSHNSLQECYCNSSCWTSIWSCWFHFLIKVQLSNFSWSTKLSSTFSFPFQTLSLLFLFFYSALQVSLAYFLSLYLSISLSLPLPLTLTLTHT